MLDIQCLKWPIVIAYVRKAGVPCKTVSLHIQKSHENLWCLEMCFLPVTGGLAIMNEHPWDNQFIRLFYLAKCEI